MLHTIDQGVASHAVGNVIWNMVCRDVWHGRTDAENVARCFADMQTHYWATRYISRMHGKLTVERVQTKGSWLNMKAKAAATRHVSTYAL